MQPWQPTDQPGGIPPGQPGWPQHPQYPQQPYGQYPYAQQPQYAPYPQYPQAPAAGPSGGTAITAAVLSFLGALANALGGISYFSLVSMTKLKGNTGIFTVLGLIYLAIAAGLVVGGYLLLQRKPVGRIIIAVACGVVIALSVIGYFLVLAALHNAGLPVSQVGAAHPMRAFGGLIFPILTMVLALVPSTLQWCQAGQARQSPPPAPWGAPPPNPPTAW